MSKLISLFLTFFIIACQVEKKSGSDDYIADHRTATNSFTIQNSQTGTFKTGDVLTFTLSFPSNITVTGSPRLALEIGATTKYANYVSGDQTKVLTFAYTITADDNDANGIRFLSINLNGGTLQFYLKEVLTNCSTTISAVHYSKILIDNTAPTITQISHAHAPGIYYWNDVLTFSVRFNEKVVVTGTPHLPVTFSTGGVKNFQYVSGSGTENLSFRYTIEDTVAAAGVTFPASITLNAGTIKDSNGNDFVNTISAPIRTNAQTSTEPLQIEGRIPKLLSVDLPPNGSYGAAQELDFILIFDRDVNIAGSPRLEVTVGSTVRYANYYAGDGTNELTFRYIPIPGDEDTNGISLNNAVIFPVATDYISSVASTTAPYRFANIATNNNLKNPNTTQIIVAAILPRIIGISRTNDSTLSLRTSSVDNVWNIGQELFLLVEFNTPIFVNNDNGSPTLSFTINGVPKTATYLSGGDGQRTLVFRYTVLEGDNSNGSDIGVGILNDNSATIEDARETQAQLTITQTTVAQTIIDGVRPVIESLTAPANGTYSTAALTNPVNFRRLDFGVVFSEPVVLAATNASDLNVTIGAATVPARATDTLSTGSTLTFTRDIAVGQNDTDGIQIASFITNPANVRDDAGNAAVNLSFSPPNSDLTNVLVDTTRPLISGVIEPPAGTYIVGETLTFTVNFNEAVSYTTSAGHPRLAIDIGGQTVYALVTSPALPEATSITFSYTIANDLQDTVISFLSLEPTTLANIYDLGRNALLPGTTLPALNNTIAVDSRAPTMTPTLLSTSGYYKEGDIIKVRVTASENVTVTGSPILRSNVGGSNVDFEYNGAASTGTQLVFEYIIQETDFDFDGIGDISSIINATDISDDAGNNPLASFSSSLPMTGIKIKPTSFLAWSAGQLTNVYDGTTPFAGATSGPCTPPGDCLTLSGTSSLTTTITDAQTIYASLQLALPPVGERLFDNNFIIEDVGGLIVLDAGPNVDQVRVDGAVITPVAGKYHLGIAFGPTFFTLEVDLSATVSTINSAGVTGQLNHLLLFSQPLTATQRAAVQAATN